LKCPQIRNLLMAYLDSELDARDTAEVAGHLDSCDSCRKRYEHEQRLERLLVADLEQDEDMPPAVWRSLEVSMGVRRSVLPWRWVAAAAAVLILAGGAFFLWGGVDRTELLRQIGTAHADVVAGRVETQVKLLKPKPVEAFLRKRGFADVQLPKLGMQGGHDVELIGAREDRFLGLLAVNLIFRCCDQLVSVFVLPGGSVASLPAGLEGEPGEVTSVVHEGFLVEAVARPDAVVTIVTEESEGHPVYLSSRF